MANVIDSSEGDGVAESGFVSGSTLTLTGALTDHFTFASMLSWTTGATVDLRVVQVGTDKFAHYTDAAYASATSITLNTPVSSNGLPFTGAVQAFVVVSATRVNTFLAEPAPSLQFDTSAGVSVSQGQLAWNADEETLDLGQNGAVLQLGQEVHVHCRNNSGVTINDGDVVMATGTLGASSRITIAKMDGTDQTNAKFIIGVATETIADGTDGKVTSFGKVRGLDTSAWSEGSVLWVSDTTVGALTSTEPSSLNIGMPIAFVVNSHASTGAIFVRVTPVNEHRHQEKPTKVTASPTTAGVTATINARHEIDISGLTASRNFTIPTGGSEGDIIEWEITTGDASFELILIGDTGVSIIMPDGSTYTAAEATRYFITNESGRLVRTSTSNTWRMTKKDDGRIPCIASYTHTQTVNSASYTRTDLSAATELANRGGTADKTNDQFTIRRAGNYHGSVSVGIGYVLDINELLRCRAIGFNLNDFTGNYNSANTNYNGSSQLDFHTSLAITDVPYFDFYHSEGAAQSLTWNCSLVEVL